MAKIRGGIRIKTTKYDSTAGIILSHYGEILMITAGHGVGAEGSVVCDASGQVIGKVRTNFYVDGTTVDLAVVQLLKNLEGVEFNTVQGIFESLYTGITIPKNRAEKGNFVSMQSPISGAQFGRLIYPDADVTDENGRKVTNVCVADYPSAPSDSGAPVLSEPHAGATCYGFHGGRYKVQGHVDLTYAWFTPMDNIEL